MEWFRRVIIQRASKLSRIFRRRKILTSLGKIFSPSPNFSIRKIFRATPGSLNKLSHASTSISPREKIFCFEKIFWRSGSSFSVRSDLGPGATSAWSDLRDRPRVHEKKSELFFYTPPRKKKGPRIKKRALFFFVDPTFYFSWTQKGPRPSAMRDQRRTYVGRSPPSFNWRNLFSAKVAYL